MLQYYDVYVELYREGKLIYKLTVPKIRDDKEMSARNVPINWSNVEHLVQSLGKDSPIALEVDPKDPRKKSIVFTKKLLVHGYNKPLIRNRDFQTHLFFRTFPIQKVPSLFELLNYKEEDNPGIVDKYMKSTYDKIS